MKLLLFILMSVAVMGQDRPDVCNHSKGYCTIKGYLESQGRYDNSNHNKPTITDRYQNNTIDLILAYADECYADSSETIGYYYPADEPFAKRRTLWLHRQPTFEGFIEYLRKRTR